MDLDGIMLCLLWNKSNRKRQILQQKSKQIPKTKQTETDSKIQKTNWRCQKGGGGMGEIDEREKKVQTFSIKELGYGNEKYSTGNIANNIAITLYGDRRWVHL